MEMHERLELVMPKSENITSSIREVMRPFEEEDLNGNSNPWGFYDWYKIGGRWAGQKEIERLGIERIEKFEDILIKKGVTLSALRAGKATLKPESQITMVDELWRDNFPDSIFET